ncbi:MAG TPA: DUF433 domain-containing protein [Verrucomicrobiota bacterium]|nr:DUF433 domain-containing protein [Verrucomicrobiota bacterium]HRZ35200.1 DUF433 domain-containing protein [Candidatus Paceibacterota bacterium]HRZ54501.1 DUF433 domain-containing protein [Candidatus Paceibacterota bacterium]
MKTLTEHSYVACAKGVCGGEPVIRGTRTAVRIIAENWRAGLSPEEIQAEYPHLTLAQVFDALSYAEDNPEEMDALIAQHHRAYEKGVAASAKRRANGRR